jgi:hypothetical protein
VHVYTNVLTHTHTGRPIDLSARRLPEEEADAAAAARATAESNFLFFFPRMQRFRNVSSRVVVARTTASRGAQGGGFVLMYLQNIYIELYA